MDKTIENKLFAEFQNGAAAMCLKYVKNVVANNGENLDEQGRKYYSAFPAKVAERTASFDDIAWPENITCQYRIAQEISDNLDNCKDDNQRERYIIEMLSVFEEWGEIFTPVARLKELEKMLKYGCTISSEQEIKQEIERVSNLHDDYLDIMRDAKKGSMEYYLNHWHRAFFKFANMLAAICAMHHINLLELQEKRGIWIIEKLSVLDLQCYFGCLGNNNYANYLLKELPRTAATEDLILTERDGVINSEAAWNSNQGVKIVTLHKEPKNKGRRVQRFRDRLNGNDMQKDETLKKLHTLIAGRKGKDVAIVLTTCVRLGLIIKPTFTEVQNEFGEIGAESGFNHYMSGNLTEDEIKGMMQNFVDK